MKYPFNLQCYGAWLNTVVIVGILIGACGCQTTSKDTPTLIQDASRKLADELAHNLSTNQTNHWRIAIKPLEILPSGEVTGKTSTISQALQESLKNRLFLTRRFDVTVVGTDMRQKVEDELRMQEGDEHIVKETWGLSSERKERLSKLLSADAIVIGTITAFDSGYLVSCQLIPFKDNLLGSVAEAKIGRMTTSSARDTGSGFWGWLNSSQGVNGNPGGGGYWNQGGWVQSPNGSQGGGVNYNYNSDTSKPGRGEGGYNYNFDTSKGGGIVNGYNPPQNAPNGGGSITTKPKKN